MKVVLAIYALAFLTFGLGVAYINIAINSDVAVREALNGVYTPPQFKYALQPADNIVVTHTPVKQGNVQTHLLGNIETTNFYQGQ